MVAAWTHIASDVQNHGVTRPVHALSKVYNATNQISETERIVFLDAFCKMVGVVEQNKLLKKQLLRNSVAAVWSNSACIVTSTSAS